MNLCSFKELLLIYVLYFQNTWNVAGIFLNKIVDWFYEIFYDIFGLAANWLPINLWRALIIDVFVGFFFPWSQSSKRSGTIFIQTFSLSKRFHFLILIIIKFQLQLLFVCSLYIFDMMNMFNMIVYEFQILVIFRYCLSVWFRIIWTLAWIFKYLVFV